VHNREVEVSVVWLAHGRMSLALQRQRVAARTASAGVTEQMNTTSAEGAWGSSHNESWAARGIAPPCMLSKYQLKGAKP
jgi:hypothetical protein